MQAAHYENYKTLRKMSGLREPSLIHFVSDGKPWRVMAMDYQNIPFSAENIAKLQGQREAHLLWRAAFFSGTQEEGIVPPATSVLFPDSYRQEIVGAASGEFDFNFGETIKEPEKPESTRKPRRKRRKGDAPKRKPKSERRKRN